MEDLARMAILYDLYASLLTERQRQALDMFYCEDFSLAEVGETMAVSRQAAHDLIRRAEKQLEHYESRLKLYDINRQKQASILLLQRAVAVEDWTAVQKALSILLNNKEA